MSWANQTRVLSERWKEFSTILGNVIIHVLTPAVKYLNAMLSNLITLAKTAVEAFGIETQIASTGAVIEDTTGAVTDLGNAAEEAGEKAKGALASFDELNLISIPDATSGDIGVSGGGLDVPTVDIPETEENVTKAESIWSKWLDGIADKTENLRSAWSRFWEMIKKTGVEIGRIFKDFYTEFLKPLAEFSITDAFPRLLDIFTKLGKSVNWNAIRTGLQNLWRALEPFTERVLYGFLKTLEAIVDIFLAPAISFTSTLLGKSLEGLAYIIKKIPPEVVEAFGGALAGIVTALLLFKGATLISGIISGIQIALSGLLSVLTANPVAALAIAVSALAGALLELYWADTQPITNRQSQIDQINDEIEAFENLKSARDEAIKTSLSEIENAQRLWGELKKITDENGNIKKGYEERALFITNELSEALGFEIKINDNVIQKYQELSGEIDKLISKQRAEILLSGQETIYKESLGQYEDATIALEDYSLQLENDKKLLEEAQQKLAEMQEQFDEFELTSFLDPNTITDALLGYSDIITVFDLERQKKQVKTYEEMVAKSEQAYEKQKALTKGYYDEINKYESAYAELLQGNTDKAIEIIGMPSMAMQKENEKISETIEDRKEILEKEIEHHQRIIEEIKKLYGKEIPNIAQSMIDNLQSEIAKKQQEIAGIGEKVGQSVAEGVKSGFENAKLTLGITAGAFTGLGAIQIPKLATGTVVPPNREFLSILGDNKREPEVVSPLSTIRRAVAEALAANASGETVIDLTINLEGDAIYRDVIRRQTAKNKAFGY